LGGYNSIWEMGVRGHGILVCKCGIISWKYVTVGFGRYNLTWQMVVCGLGVQICKCGIVSCKYVTVVDGTL